MAISTQFRKRLGKIFERRAAWLYSIFNKPKPGRPKKINRAHVNDAIDELQELASAGLADGYARKEFERSVKDKKSWHVKRGKGWGVSAKKSAFNDWYEVAFGNSSCVYILWKTTKCEYIGKSSNGGGRPSFHFEKFWFSGITRIDIYKLTPRNLPAIECLAIHRFQPRRNKFRASAHKWTKKCPMCIVHKAIEDDVRSIFRLRI
jgi:hypothetical protein